MNKAPEPPAKAAQTEEKHAQVSPLELNPQLVAAMLAAIREQPESVGLSDAHLLQICERAMLENRLHDQNWLQAELRAAHYQPGAHESHFHAAHNIHPEGLSDIETPQTLSPDQMPQAPHDGLRDHNKLAHIPVAEHRSPATQEGIDQVLERHANWIASVLHPNKELEAGRANLQGSDLRAFQLKGADLRGASLQGVQLDGCDLSGCNFSTARLQGASLKGCDLSHAKLRRTDLTGADLEGANLEGADLSRALLEGANLAQTLLQPTEEDPQPELSLEEPDESAADQPAAFDAMPVPEGDEPDGEDSFEFDDGSSNQTTSMQ